MAEKKFFVDINLQGSALTNATIGTNSSLTKAGSFGFDGTRLKYFNGTAIEEVANLADVAAVTGGLIFQGGYDPETAAPDISDGTAYKGFFWVATAAGAFFGESVQVGDSIVAKVDGAGATIADWLILQGNIVIATDSVDGISRLATQTEANDGTEGGAVVITPATLQGKIDAQITPEISSKLPLAGGTMSGDLNMGNNNIENAKGINGNSISVNNAGIDVLGSKTPDGKISLNSDLDSNGIAKVTNLPAPTDGGDATNKTYVDGAASTAQANAEATASADATTKADAAEAAANAYTDTGLAARLALAGGTMEGNINMGTYNLTNAEIIEGINGSFQNLSGVNPQINIGKDLDFQNSQKPINLPAPTANGDATNKEYVDTAAATAESDANAYTDTQVNLSSFRVELEVGDWTLNGSTYEATVNHNILNTGYPVVTFTDHLDFTVELVYQAISGTAIKVFSNILPVLIGVSLSAAAPRA
jgi:hypothetical protein